METKPAIYTTEFWLHNAIQVLLFLNSTGTWHYLPTIWGQIATTGASAIAALGLFLSRGIAKKGKAFDPNYHENYTLIPRHPNTVAAAKRTRRASAARSVPGGPS